MYVSLLSGIIFNLLREKRKEKFVLTLLHIVNLKWKREKLPAIKATNISKDYKQGRRKPVIKAVDNLSIEVQEGEVFGFLGPNGSGKTTFLKVLLNIIYPTTGNAQLLGIDVNDLNARRDVGYLPENPYFYDRMTGHQLLEFYGAIYGMKGDKLKKRSQDVLKMVGLTEASIRPLRGYSKGMLQRIGLAQAILSEPKLVFLDEPSTGLDPMGRKKIKDIIQGLKERGTTVFLNSHILGDVEDTCDRVGILKNGRLLRVEKVADLTIDRHIIHVRLENVDEDLIQKIQNGIRSCKIINNNVLELTIDSPDETPGVVARIVEAGGRIYEVRYQETSLEDTFIDIIGDEEEIS